jgi:hypothetical protein
MPGVGQPIQRDAVDDGIDAEDVLYSAVVGGTDVYSVVRCAPVV